jgi:uncharacterized membrane protein YbhN (UPF0104 family)
LKNKIFSVLQIVITVFFVYFTISNLDLSKLFEVLNNINILYLIIAASIYFSSQIISSERLRYILNDNKFIISFKQNFTLYLIGLFYNFFIPGGIGGDAYKSFLMNKKFNWKLSKVVKLLLLDRLIGLGVLCCILIGLYEIIFLNFNFIYLILTLCFLSIIGYYMVKLIFKNQNIFWKSFLYSLSSHTIQFISLFIILYSLGIEDSYFEIIIVFILSSIFSVFSFGGIGIREYIFLSSASILNFSPELSASIGLLFTISAAISSLPGLKFIISKPDYLK